MATLLHCHYARALCLVSSRVPASFSSAIYVFQLKQNQFPSLIIQSQFHRVETQNHMMLPKLVSPAFTADDATKKDSETTSHQNQDIAVLPHATMNMASATAPSQDSSIPPKSPSSVAQQFNTVTTCNDAPKSQEIDDSIECGACQTSPSTTTNEPEETSAVVVASNCAVTPEAVRTMDILSSEQTVSSRSELTDNSLITTPDSTSSHSTVLSDEQLKCSLTEVLESNNPSHTSPSNIASPCPASRQPDIVDLTTIDDNSVHQSPVYGFDEIDIGTQFQSYEANEIDLGIPEIDISSSAFNLDFPTSPDIQESPLFSEATQISKSPSSILGKRGRSEVDNEGERQQPPRKKPHAKFVSIWGPPAEKSGGDVDATFENTVANSLEDEARNDLTCANSELNLPSSPSLDFDLEIEKAAALAGTEQQASITEQPEVLANTNHESSTIDIREAQTCLKKPFAEETIEVHVGPKSKCVLVDKRILAKSPYFAALFAGYDKIEIVPQVVFFQDFDTGAFATIIYWLYHGNIESIAMDHKADDLFNTTLLIKIYCLCHKLGLLSLMNLAIELLGHGYLKNKSAPTIEEIDLAYTHSGPTSGLRTYMAAWARCREHAPLQKFLMVRPWDRARFKTLCEEHPELSENLEHLNKGIGLEGSKSLNPQFHQICWYHDHLNGEKCGVAEHTFDTAVDGVKSRLHEPL